MLYYIPLWRAPPPPRGGRRRSPVLKAKGGEAGAPFSQLDREREGQEKKPPMGKKVLQGGQKDQPKKETEKGLSSLFLFLNGQTVLRTIYTVQRYSADFGGRWFGIRRFLPGFPDRKQVFSSLKTKKAQFPSKSFLIVQKYSLNPVPFRSGP